MYSSKDVVVVVLKCTDYRGAVVKACRGTLQVYLHSL